MNGVFIRALLFDFDGLLCDTERAARKSWQELFLRFGATFPDQLWNAMIGRSNGHLIAITELAALLGHPVDDESVAWRLVRKTELSDREPLRPGAREMIEQARGSGIRLAVVSSSNATWVCGHLDRLGVRNLFDVIVTGDQVRRHKPAPDAYLRSADLLSVDVTEMVAFEDSPAGIAAAKAAGLRCVAVPSSVGDPSQLMGADLVVSTLLDDRVKISALAGEWAYSHG